MPGIPLLNLGTALGGFTQGYQNAENNRIQNALRQIALSQALSQQRSQALAGRGLAAGLLDQLQTNAPQMLPTGAPPMPTGGVTPPMPGAPSTPATPPVMQPPEPPVDPSEATFTPPEPSGPAVAGTYTPAQPGEWKESYVTPQPTAAQMAPRAAPSAPPQTASAGTSDAQPEAPAAPETHVVAGLPNGQQIGIPELFKVIDTTKVAQGLARLAPDADPADIYQATSDLLKLSAGNKNEQLQAAYLAKLMGINLNIQSRERGQDIASADRAAARDVALRGQDVRAGTAAAGQEAADARQRAGFAHSDEQLDKRQQFQKNQQLAREAATRSLALERDAARRGDQAATREANNIRREISSYATRYPAGDYPDDVQKRMDALIARLGKLNDAAPKQ